ncbi:MAG: hypothetical protein WDM76_14710 [Limisphaerales bacterium]
MMISLVFHALLVVALLYFAQTDSKDHRDDGEREATGQTTRTTESGAA